MSLIHFKEKICPRPLQGGFLKSHFGRVWCALKVAVPLASASLFILSCNEITPDSTSPANGSTRATGSTSNTYFSLSNSQVLVSNALLALGGKSTVTLILRDDANQPVLSKSPKVYFYYYGGTSQGYFDGVSDHLDGSYSAVFTALNPGSDLTIHVRVDDQEIVTSDALPNIKIPGGPPKSISILSGKSQSGRATSSLPVPFSVQVKDASGTVLPGVQVTWVTTSGGGTLSPALGATNLSGITSSQLTLGPRSGVNIVTASTLGSQLTATFSALATTVPFTQTWIYDPAFSSNYSYDPTRISFNTLLNSCELYLKDHIDQGNTSTGFGGGVLQGLTYDSSTQYLRLGSSGSCDGTTSNCSELSSAWTPKWSSVQGYWKLNESSLNSGNDFTDSSGKGNFGTSNGAITLGGTGKLGNSLTMGSGSFVSFSGANAAISAYPNTFTVGVWVKPTSTRNATAEAVTGITGTSGQSYAVYPNCAGSGTAGIACVGLSVGTNGISVFEYASAYMPSPLVYPTTLSNWTHVVLVYNAKTPKLYVNGVLVRTGLKSNQTNLRAGVVLGDLSGSYGPFRGGLDEFAVWGTALTDTDVKTIYERQAPRFSGSLTSRIMDAGAPQTWTTFAWLASLPFSKALPDSGLNETIASYPGLINNTLLTGLRGLWHFDETVAATAPAGKDYIDSSGNGKHGTKTGTPTFGIKGAFNRAVAFNTKGANMPVTIGTTVTISIWASISQASFGLSPMLWRTGPSGTGPDLFFSGGIAYLNTFDGTGNPYGPIPTSVYDGRLHHFVTVIDASMPKSDLYFDGVKIGSANYRNPSATSLSISSNLGTYEWNGVFDETAVWSRALSSAEIKLLYRRGVNQIRFQVRTCTTATCSDDLTGANWKGSNGTSATYLSEFNNNTLEETATGAVKNTAPLMTLAHYTNPPASAQYFQYRALLESEDAGNNCNYGAGITPCSPELKSITIGPANYDTSAPSIISKIGVSFLDLTNLTEILGSACTFGVGYNIGIGADSSTAAWYYWASAKGSDCNSAGSGSWCPSDGTASNSSTAFEISSHAPAFAGSAGTGIAYLKSYLKSSGASNCTLHEVDLSGQN